MHIAIEGCSHGELDTIYNSVLRLEQIHGFKVDLLLCCGDFQSVRNEQDLKCMACPVKYMDMRDFYKYYSGEKKAPMLTIFIGGNHEASNYLQEFPYGGWVAPNIYYLGYAGVVRFGGLRIGGLSGIYKGPDYLKGHYEKPPYTGESVRSVYHVRNLEVFRLKQLSGESDIFMSHDWPRGIYHHGDKEKLLKWKQHFRSEVKNNTLGSRPAEELLKKIRPKYWFSGHLHVKFPAVLRHKDENTHKAKVTKFLALDKCLPRRDFLQVIEVQNAGPLELSYDAEWLTILRLTNHLLSVGTRTVYMPGPGGSERYQFTPTKEEIDDTIQMMGCNLKVPLDFVPTAQSYESSQGKPKMEQVHMPDPLLNPQTIVAPKGVRGEPHMCWHYSQAPCARRAETLLNPGRYPSSFQRDEAPLGAPKAPLPALTHCETNVMSLTRSERRHSSTVSDIRQAAQSRGSLCRTGLNPPVLPRPTPTHGKVQAETHHTLGKCP
ncbi:lariat debranching enzyme A-like [Penaeus indicus]|uniref:lariat debranching enzyme A-like n=1 Tax=Penaeus indicus TaxID=29960 RepID=UPI00300CE0D5